VAGSGYEQRDDHGQITHESWSQRSAGHVVEALAWRDATGVALLYERRERRWEATAERVWRLGLAFALSPSGEDPVELGSPGSAGLRGQRVRRLLLALAAEYRYRGADR
jgi:hypothetical protein